MQSNTATVETLTAEVRVLMVGNRQITLSIFKQLDAVHPDRLIPFGRVRSGAKYDTRYSAGRLADLELIGADEDGNLVKAVVINGDRVPNSKRAFYAELQALPLIVLAGLK